MAEKIQASFTNYLKKQSRQQTARPPNPQQTVKCALCDAEIHDATEELYGDHLRRDHAKILEETALDEKEGKDGKEGVKIGVEGQIEALWKKALRPVLPLSARWVCTTLYAFPSSTCAY